MGRFLRKLKRFVALLAWFFLFSALLSRSSTDSLSARGRLDQYITGVEFNYVTWDLGALWKKVGQFALGTSGYLEPEARSGYVLEYLQILADTQEAEASLRSIYADPAISDPEAASSQVRQSLQELYARRDQIAPLAESIFQNQASVVVADMGLSFAGQPLPPLLFQITPLPRALIISPRDEIYQLANLSVDPDLPVDRQAEIEQAIFEEQRVSALVVPVGGIGMYPTMIIATADINWLAEVVCHEWVHNFLTVRPLGASYMNSPELRIMNETTASIAGVEMGSRLIELYYPDYMPAPPAEQGQPGQPQPRPSGMAFNFNKELHRTRLVVDELLEMGQIEFAETYMEQRRAFIWAHGYRIRKLNQAYFAFYGAYADQPGGAAGADPVGTAVRQLRAQSDSLAQFLKTIAWMYDFTQLELATAP